MGLSYFSFECPLQPLHLKRRINGLAPPIIGRVGFLVDKKKFWQEKRGRTSIGYGRQRLEIPSHCITNSINPQHTDKMRPLTETEQKTVFEKVGFRAETIQ